MAPPTDVATGWTEPRALKNKARVWVTDPLIAKTRDGAKVPRRHDTPTTPYQRLPDCGTLTKTQAAKADRPLPQTQAAKLTALYRSLNPAQLRRDIAGCQRQLRDLSNQRTRTACMEVTPALTTRSMVAGSDSEGRRRPGCER